MKKILRLQQLQLFLNGKKRFTVKEVMQELQISRSTALRYIADIEAMGIPLYSERGRHGGFLIESTYRIVPIRFTADEIKAMLFAIASMDIFQSTPFKQQLSLIKDKLKQVLPADEQVAFNHLNRYLAIHSVKQIHKTLHLDRLLQYILNKHNVRLVLNDGNVCCLRPIALWFKSGRWFVAGYEFRLDDLRIIRCDKITSCEIEQLNLTAPASLSLDDYCIANIDQLRQKQKQAIFYLYIQPEGLEHFYSHSFSHIQVEETQQGYILSAHYNQDEYQYVLDYINGFSRYLLDIKPAELKKQYCEVVKGRIDQLMKGSY